MSIGLLGVLLGEKMIKCHECGKEFEGSWQIYCQKCYLMFKTGGERLAIAGEIYSTIPCNAGDCGGRVVILADGAGRCERCGCLMSLDL
jgi:hypothetical protein